ncbi:MAG: hypothetical protein RLZZ157_1280 [Pseudomonadota bacterium]
MLPRPTGELSAKLTEGVFAAAEAPSERFAPTSPAVAGEDNVFMHLLYSKQAGQQRTWRR